MKVIYLSPEGESLVALVSTIQFVSSSEGFYAILDNRTRIEVNRIKSIEKEA